MKVQLPGGVTIFFRIEIFLKLFFGLFGTKTTHKMILGARAGGIRDIAPYVRRSPSIYRSMPLPERSSFTCVTIGTILGILAICHLAKRWK